MSDLTEALNDQQPLIDWMLFCVKTVKELQDRKSDLEYIGVDNIELDIDTDQINISFCINRCKITVLSENRSKMWSRYVYEDFVDYPLHETRWNYWYTALLSGYKALNDYKKDMK